MEIGSQGALGYSIRDVSSMFEYLPSVLSLVNNRKMPPVNNFYSSDVTG
jgi:hypothetical protein